MTEFSGAHYEYIGRIDRLKDHDKNVSAEDQITAALHEGFNGNSIEQCRAWLSRNAKQHRPALLVAQRGLCNCCFCDVSNGSQIDHMLPRSRGGGNKGNLQLLCAYCNSLKWTLTVAEHRQMLLLLPTWEGSVDLEEVLTCTCTEVKGPKCWPSLRYGGQNAKTDSTPAIATACEVAATPQEQAGASV